MIQDTQNIIGIAGGMGPQAGIALMSSILQHTRATRDQQHLPVILMSFPSQITDRTAFLDGKDPVNPAFAIAKVIHRLEVAGANIIGMSCNTSYAPAIYGTILEQLDKMNSSARMIHMPAETAYYLREDHGPIRRIGVMTTNGAYRARVYENMLLANGFDPVIPDPDFQNDVIHRMVYDPLFGIKANTHTISPEVRALADETFGFFKKREAEAVILGCTEFSLISPARESRGMVIVDSVECLARSLVREAQKIKGQPIINPLLCST